MFEQKIGKVKAWLSHRVIYGGLCLCHVYAAFATGKPEVYVPVALLYAVLAWKG